MTATRTAPLAILATVALALVAAGCGQGATAAREGAQPARPAQRTAPAQSTESAPSEPGARRLQAPRSDGVIPTGKAPPVAVEIASGVQVATPVRTAAVKASERFAVTLTRWLYGDRRRLEVEPITGQLAREIDRDPPAFIPDDQRNTDQGRIRDISLAIQTPRSGVVAVTVNDLRTDIYLFAQIELRDGRWVIVRFNDD